MKVEAVTWIHCPNWTDVLRWSSPFHDGMPARVRALFIYADGTRTADDLARLLKTSLAEIDALLRELIRRDFVRWRDPKAASTGGAYDRPENRPDTATNTNARVPGDRRWWLDAAYGGRQAA